VISSLTLTESGDNFTVPVAIAGKHLQFKFEVGAAYTAITASVAKELGLTEGALPRKIMPQIEDQPITKRVAVQALQIDRVTAHDLYLLEIPSLTVGDGILGLDILAAYDLELDLAHDKVNLFARDHCTGKVIYWSSPGGAVAVLPLTRSKTGSVLTNMALDAKPVTAGFPA
jgi:hypothetical protein